MAGFVIEGRVVVFYYWGFWFGVVFLVERGEVVVRFVSLGWVLGVFGFFNFG